MHLACWKGAARATGAPRLCRARRGPGIRATIDAELRAARLATLWRRARGTRAADATQGRAARLRVGQAVGEAWAGLAAAQTSPDRPARPHLQSPNTTCNQPHPSSEGKMENGNRIESIQSRWPTEVTTLRRPPHSPSTLEGRRPHAALREQAPDGPPDAQPSPGLRPHLFQNLSSRCTMSMLQVASASPKAPAACFDRRVLLTLRLRLPRATDAPYSSLASRCNAWTPPKRDGQCPVPRSSTAERHSGPTQAARTVSGKRHQSRTGCLQGPPLDPSTPPTACTVTTMCRATAALCQRWWTNVTLCQA